MAIDFEAEGLLDGTPSGPAREARLELLRTLEDEGFSLEALRRATRENRLALLPVERVLEAEGERYTAREVAERVGLELAFVQDARRALGFPAIDPDERALPEEEVELARQAAILLAAGLDPDGFLELTHVMSQAMGTVAASLIATLGEALLRPGDTERDLGLRYADSLRNLAPLAGPALQNMLNMRMREQIRQAVIGQAELESGHLPGAQPVVVAFVDIVGFTELGEQVPPEELGAVVRDFERRTESVAQAPVRLVKTIGDAAMLVAPTPDPLLDAVLALVESSRTDANAPVRAEPGPSRTDADAPVRAEPGPSRTDANAPVRAEPGPSRTDADGTLLRAGVASGEALPRAGDWYGRPVNLASRLTTFARSGSVVASEDVRQAARGDFAWSFAGRRRFRGVTGEVSVYRVRVTSSR